MGWAACRGCLLGSGPGFEVPKLEYGTPCLNQLILWRHFNIATMVKWNSHNKDYELHSDILKPVTGRLKIYIFLTNTVPLLLKIYSKIKETLRNNLT